MDGEKQEDSRRAATASSFASAAVTTATVCPGSSAGTRAPSGSLGIVSPDRTAVQVLFDLAAGQVSLPASPVTAQLVGRTQNSISSGVSTTISQQAVLLGGRPDCNQAQMYLRTQMVKKTLEKSGAVGCSSTFPSWLEQFRFFSDDLFCFSCFYLYLLVLLCQLILTPAASVAPVQSDLPAVTSCSSASNASQVETQARQPLICRLACSGCYAALA
ncbi:unnamed protein product [Tetraodon nigroviridis]|uniref:(spotted green pufferfish) hypothetical protein n=1 Tax=Tetraodon nigroviridis TaxID=99883 RepID=Q4RWN5_TETNG|nr:unnamed protein product [Tetraodon nigroviridis]